MKCEFVAYINSVVFFGQLSMGLWKVRL